MPKRVSYFPDPVQELLLKAILFDGDEALRAWAAWRGSIAVEDIDLASQRLLPMLYDNLTKLGVTGPEMDRYRGVARYVWLDNQLLMRTALDVLALLDQHGVPAMPIKGIAIAPRYYADARLRAMSDVDILVPFNETYRAADILCANGWQCKNDIEFRMSVYRSVRHAATFKQERGPDVDLHWHISHESPLPELADSLWAHAQPLALAGFSTKTLSDTDQLFHICIHGGRPNTVPPIRWVVDAAVILRHGTIDWQRFLLQTQQYDVVQRMQRMLGYLRDVFRLSIPETQLTALRGMPPSKLERIHDAIIFSGAHRHIKAATVHIGRYRRTVRGRSNDHGFLRYLQAAAGTTSLPQTAVFVFRRL